MPNASIYLHQVQKNLTYKVVVKTFGCKNDTNTVLITMPSAYERARLENIAGNEAKLRELNVGDFKGTYKNNGKTNDNNGKGKGERLAYCRRSHCGVVEEPRNSRLQLFTRLGCCRGTGKRRESTPRGNSKRLAK